MKIRKEQAKNLKESLIKNSFWSFSAITVNRIGGLIFTIILARFLMPERYGIYSIVLSIAMIFCTFMDLGTSKTLIRYISSALATNKKKVSGYHFYILKIKFILALASSALLLILSYPLTFYVFKKPVLFLPLITASFYIFVLTFEGFYTSLFYAIEKVRYINFKESLKQIMRVVFVLFVFYFISSSYQIIGIFLTLTLASILSLIFVLYHAKRLMPSIFQKSKIKINKKRVRKFMVSLSIASISAVFFSYIDSIMLGIFLSLEYVGYYRAAFNLILGISGIFSFGFVLLPVLTKIKGQKIKEVLEKMFKYLSIITIPTIFGILVLGKYFIKVYGSSYLPAALPLYFLSFLIFLIISTGLFLSLFEAKEKPQIFTKLMIIIGLINIILNFILIKIFLLISPLWATAGAAIATLISWTFYFVASIYITKKEFKFSIPFRVLIKPFFSGFVMFISLYCLLLLIKEVTLFLGMSLIFFGMFIYFILMLLIKGITKEDLDLIRILIKKNNKPYFKN